jgi:heme oxygenase
VWASAQAYHEDVRRLVYWHVEDVLKTKYAEFVETLSTASKDPLEHLKNKSIKSAQVLLARKPEQEHALLRVLVNKLGDPARKVSLPIPPDCGCVAYKPEQEHALLRVLVNKLGDPARKVSDCGCVA